MLLFFTKLNKNKQVMEPNVTSVIPSEIDLKSHSKQTEEFDSPVAIVQEKFKKGEHVIAIFEAYQIIGDEHSNRLLALVTSTGSYAIFSFAVTRLPPKAFSDLAIDNIYPLNEYFKLVTDNKETISKLQFDLVTTNLSSKFYYYLFSGECPNDFETFHRHVIAAKVAYNQNKHMTTLDVIEPVVPIEGVSEASFRWLNAYNRKESFHAIDRYIADGSKPLKKGESKFQDELKKRESEYIVYNKYRIFCATWNVNGHACREPSLKEWLVASEEPPDIYAIALQEVDLSPKAITFNESRPDTVWIDKMMRNLYPDIEYEELKSVRLVGMMLTIIVRRNIRPNVTRCVIQAVGTGALNFMGNKGGVAVSMTLNEGDICFVNSHLAAHLSEVERRNEDFCEINKRCIFEGSQMRKMIDQHDHIFWIGDLNYRIFENPGITLNYDNYAELFRYDQLINAMASGRAFKDYTEGKISFRPTYKYDPGTDVFDSSEKNRAPAWCDRILWKGLRIEQLSYNSVMEIRQSDHKPVYAVFTAGIKSKDEKKYKRVHEDVLKRVDKYENDNQPQITVEKTDIDFDTIVFNEMHIRDFTVANNCHLPVNFSFKAKDGDDKKICEEWLSVEPQLGNLITGTSLSIRLKLLVKFRNAADLLKIRQGVLSTRAEDKNKVVLDILVLHVEDGRDIFITIIGECKPSCFGLCVDTLCRSELPIAEYSMEQIRTIQSSVDQTPCKVSMPREIFLLIDYLHNYTKNATDLFPLDRKYAENKNINDIRDWLDMWSNDEFPGSPHTAAEALLMLLESADKPLLHPFEEDFLKSETFDKSSQLVLLLTSPRRNVFLHICMFLRDKNFNQNNIATVFGNVLLKGRRRVQGFSDDRCRSFMLRFIYDGDFSNFTRENIFVE